MSEIKNNWKVIKLISLNDPDFQKRLYVSQKINFDENSMHDISRIFFNISDLRLSKSNVYIELTFTEVFNLINSVKKIIEYLKKYSKDPNKKLKEYYSVKQDVFRGKNAREIIFNIFTNGSRIEICIVNNICSMNDPKIDLTFEKFSSLLEILSQYCNNYYDYIFNINLSMINDRINKDLISEIKHNNEELIKTFRNIFFSVLNTNKENFDVEIPSEQKSSNIKNANSISPDLFLSDNLSELIQRPPNSASHILEDSDDDLLHSDVVDPIFNNDEETESNVPDDSVDFESHEENIELKDQEDDNSGENVEIAAAQNDWEKTLLENEEFENIQIEGLDSFENRDNHYTSNTTPTIKDPCRLPFSEFFLNSDALYLSNYATALNNLEEKTNSNMFSPLSYIFERSLIDSDEIEKIKTSNYFNLQYFILEEYRDLVSEYVITGKNKLDSTKIYKFANSFSNNEKDLYNLTKEIISIICVFSCYKNELHKISGIDNKYKEDNIKVLMLIKTILCTVIASFDNTCISKEEFITECSEKYEEMEKFGIFNNLKDQYKNLTMGGIFSINSEKILPVLNSFYSLIFSSKVISEKDLFDDEYKDVNLKSDEDIKNIIFNINSVEEQIENVQEIQEDDEKVLDNLINGL